MLILKTLQSGGELHGFEIANAIQKRTEDVLRVDEGSLYPALQRMLLKGWVTGEWAIPRRTGARAITGSPGLAASIWNKSSLATIA